MTNSDPTTHEPSDGRRGRRATVISAVALLAAAAVAAGVWTGVGAAAPGAGAGPAASGAPTVDQAADPATIRRVQNSLDGLVELGFPAALASLTQPDGEHDDLVAGVGDLDTGAPVPVDGEVRAGSNTKTFTAVVVLQLVQEGLVELDAPIDRYLPGLVHGEGIDPAAITVRRLLQHTSGLPDYTSGIATEIEAIQHSYLPPRDLLDLALARPADFAPGAKWAYSNTNYLLLGMLIERITERPLFEEVTRRIIEPLGLGHSYFPAVGEQGIRGAHPTGYHRGADGELFDVTELDPSWGWAAGQVVASPSDLNEFFRAVLDGRLLGDRMRAEMQSTVPADEGLWPGSEYGLGLQSYPLSCGGVIWGHGGDIHGFETRNGVAADGTAFTVAVTSLPWGFIDVDDEDRLMAAYQAVTSAVDAAFCDRG